MPMRRRFVASIAISGLALTAGLTGGAPGAGAAPSAACPAVSSLFVTSKSLVPVDATGKSGTPITLTKVYFDIAYSADGSTLYAITNDGGKIFVLNPTTGAETKTITVTGAAVGQSVNSLTSLPSGKLLMGQNALYEVDPATGVSTASDYTLPQGSSLGGDVLALPGGDVLAALSDGTLARLHPDKTATAIGTVASPYALAGSGGGVVIGSSDGKLSYLASVPTAAGTSALTTTAYPDSGAASYFGGASIQDSGQCNVPATVADTAKADFGASVAVSVLANDSSGGSQVTLDPTSLRLINNNDAVASTDVKNVGIFTAAGDGTITFAPADGFTGTTPVQTYRVANSLGQTATGTLTVTIAAAPASSSAAASSGSATSSGSAGSSSAAASADQVTPTAVPAGFDKDTDDTDDTGVVLALGGVSLLLLAGAGTSLLRTRRRQH